MTSTRAPRNSGREASDGPRSRRPLRTLRPAAAALAAAAVIVAATTVAYFVGARGEPVYGAQIDIYFQPDDSVVEIERQMVSQQALVSSDVVLSPLAAGSGLTRDDLREHMEVDVLTNSQILRVTIGSVAGAETAQELAQSVAQRYVETLERDPPGRLGTAWIVSESRALDGLLEPRPLQSAASGLLVGLVLAAGLVFALFRPGNAG